MAKHDENHAELSGNSANSAKEKSEEDQFDFFAGNYGDHRDEDNPNVHYHMNPRLFVSLVAMSFLWVGSQIPLYLFGSVLPIIYSEIGGGNGVYLWMVIGYLIPNAALCPFVGALSDLFGRRVVAAFGQILLMIGPIVVSTSHDIHPAIAGMVVSGMGAGFNELIALAGTSELVPIRKRGIYVACVVFTILPFCPSPMWAQLIATSDWRWIGLLVGIWNLIGLILVTVFYRDPPKVEAPRPKREILREIDYIGGFLSTSGVVCFMMGMQWGANQYTWTTTHVLVPFCIGIFLIICFFVWEFNAPYPMAPAHLFSKDKRTMTFILLITFLSGGNFFAMLLFWPTQAYNMYGSNPIGIGIRTLPIGFGIIGGAIINLLMIGFTGGRTRMLMLFWTVFMTAFVGAMAAANLDNLNTLVYPILTLGNVGVGAVIIPCSIIAQIVAPTKLIGTITAITLSIRYIGGAIGFTAYYVIFYHKVKNAGIQAATQLVVHGVSFDVTVLRKLILLTAEAEFEKAKEMIANNPMVLKKDCFPLLVENVQQMFAVAYRYPYLMSIAFGGSSILLSIGLKDIRKFM